MPPRAAVVLLFVFACGARAQEPPSLQAIADEYLSFETYCDSGKHAERVDPAKPYPEEYTFRRCATRDGRFKYVDRNARVGDSAKWSDGEKYYRYLEYNRHYQALRLGDPSSFDLYRDRSQSFAVFLFQPLSRDPGRLASPLGRPGYLASYALNAAESTPQHWVYERSEPGLTILGNRTTWRERLWVSKAERRIVRWAALEDRGEVKFTEIAWHQENQPLAPADLRYDVPLTARYSLSNNLPAFLAILFASSALVGLIFWLAVFARASSRQAIRERRRLLWKWQLVPFALMEALLGVLAFFVRGGSGHPPAIVFVYVLAVWTAIIFGLVACFTIASYPAQAIVREKV